MSTADKNLGSPSQQATSNSASAVETTGQDFARWAGTWVLNPALKPGDKEAAAIAWTIRITPKNDGFAIVQDITVGGNKDHEDYFARFDGVLTKDAKGEYEYGMQWVRPNALKLRYRVPGSAIGAAQTYTLSDDGTFLTQERKGWIFDRHYLKEVAGNARGLLEQALARAESLGFDIERPSRFVILPL